MPEAQVIPELAYPDVGAAVDWLCKAFGFAVRLRIGDHRAQLKFGSGVIVVRSGAMAAQAAGSHSVMVRVEDVDAHYAKAMAGGAKASGGPTTYPYGERQYAAQDPWGHGWVFSQSVEDVPPSAWGGELVSE
jgi:uncharacterized glyoxalase superfamily protein PhnB